jgi:hypothetical protein
MDLTGGGSGGGSVTAPVDCVVSPWVDGAEGCTSKCGGTKTQTRQVITEEANGGKSCPVYVRVLFYSCAP